MCQINIDMYLLARYKQGGRVLPDVDCYGLVLEFFKTELKIRNKNMKVRITCNRHVNNDNIS